ncbi:MAG: helix-turn-helix domain-containing protein [Pseudomonadota bacterium]
MIVRKLRLQNGWSQDQLAQLSGLNIRTIQRIERGHTPSLESLKSLAAVFEVEVNDLTAEATMTPVNELSLEEQQVLEHVRDIKGFYQHLITYGITIVFLFVVNFLVSPGYWWALWAMLGWGIGVVSHGISVFEVFDFLGPDWEKREVEKRLGKKL